MENSSAKHRDIDFGHLTDSEILWLPEMRDVLVVATGDLVRSSCMPSRHDADNIMLILISGP